MIVSALKSQGIPAYVDGTLLQDEFYISQRTSGLKSVEIQVHADREAEARKIIAAMRESGKLLEGGDRDEKDGEKED